MIVSASRRTDIPAFFSKWFMNRIKEGFVYVRNPMNIHQVSEISLSKNVVDCIVFWTKNPAPFLIHIPLERYNYYFQFTINAYGKAIEPNIPTVQDALASFRELSMRIGPERVIWRYDPIMLTDRYSIDWHINTFSSIAQFLKGYTRKCIISFIDLYKKTEKNLLGIKLIPIGKESLFHLCSRINEIAAASHMEVNTCAEEIDLSSLGIRPGKCIDNKLIEEISGLNISIQKDKVQRKECGCVASIDIGGYNTCPHNCLYCYANYSLEAVRNNYAQHDPASPLLFGKIDKQKDSITKRKVESCFVIQQRLL